MWVTARPLEYVDKLPPSVLVRDESRKQDSFKVECEAMRDTMRKAEDVIRSVNARPDLVEPIEQASKRLDAT